MSLDSKLRSRDLMKVRGRSSVVERQLPKLNVVGSIPIARSSTPLISAHFRLLRAERQGNKRTTGLREFRTFLARPFRRLETRGRVAMPVDLPTLIAIRRRVKNLRASAGWRFEPSAYGPSEFPFRCEGNAAAT